MTFLYSDAAGGGRKRKLRESEPSAGEGTNNIPHTKAPTLKKKKGPVNQPKSPPEKPTEPGQSTDQITHLASLHSERSKMI